MPTYEYKCPRCGHTKTERRAVSRRDELIVCMECIDVTDDIDVVLMERQPSAPGFIVEGFNAANGYSSKS